MILCRRKASCACWELQYGTLKTEGGRFYCDMIVMSLLKPGDLSKEIVHCEWNEYRVEVFNETIVLVDPQPQVSQL